MHRIWLATVLTVAAASSAAHAPRPSHEAEPVCQCPCPQAQPPSRIEPSANERRAPTNYEGSHRDVNTPRPFGPEHSILPSTPGLPTPEPVARLRRDSSAPRSPQNTRDATVI